MRMVSIPTDKGSTKAILTVAVYIIINTAKRMEKIRINFFENWFLMFSQRKIIKKEYSTRIKRL